MRRISQTTELGLGGSLLAQVLAEYSSGGLPGISQRFWMMNPVDLSGDGTNWQILSYGLQGNALEIEPSDASGVDMTVASGMPESSRGIRLNGTTGYLQSSAFTNFQSTYPWTLEVVVTLHALPSVGQEPAIAAKLDGQFGLTLRSDGRVYGYYNNVAVVNAPIPIGQPVHLALTRAGTSTDSVKLYINGALVSSATPARVTGTLVVLRAGRHWTNTHYLSATYGFLAEWPIQMAANVVAAHAAAAIWTNVSVDVRDSETLAIERGIRDVNDPTARVAGPSTCALALDNSNQNSAKKAGYYSPGHVDCRPGFTKGAPLRVTLTPSDGSPLTQFVGRLRVIAPTAGTVDEQLTRVFAYDWLDDAGRCQLTGVPLLQNVRASDVIAALVSRVQNQPPGIEIDPTTDVYPYALHNAQDEKTAVLSELVRIENSELGYVATLRTGALRCENRARRLTTSYAPAGTLSDFLDIDVVETGATTPNRVLVTAHPTVTDPSATTVLYALTNPLPIGPGTSVSFTGPYRADSAPTKSARIGGVDTVVPVPTTDYVMNSKADGTGTNLTPFLVATPVIGANAVTWLLENSSASPAWITKLQLRGKGIYDFRSQVATAESAEAIAADGLVELSLDQPYVQDLNQSQGAADMLLDKVQAQGRRARTVLLSLNDPVHDASLLARDFGDRVRLIDAQSALDFEGHISYVRIELEMGGKATVRWGLVPAEMRKFWILGVVGHRELGINTRLAFF
jgi:hypothetical protein